MGDVSTHSESVFDIPRPSLRATFPLRGKVVQNVIPIAFAWRVSKARRVVS